MILVDPRLKGVLNKLLAIRAWQCINMAATKKANNTTCRLHFAQGPFMHPGIGMLTFIFI